MGFHFDSRHIKEGDIFICLPGGAIYIDEAFKKGAIGVKKMTRAEMASFADEHFEHPTQQLTVIGVTGTNGKTTVTRLIHEALEHAGYKSIVIGTLTHPLTTPESWDLQKIAADHLKNGGTHLVMEVSSHGIAQDRVKDIDFDCRVLTNITQDHLDYHGSFEEYKKCKLSFMKGVPGTTIFPRDYDDIEINFEHQLIGSFNEDNIRAAIAALRSIGLSEPQIETGLSQASPVPGRLEYINESQPYIAVVDYAHTPHGLETVCGCLRDLADERGGALRVLFGCGGDRDRGKRPKMAAAASIADTVILTQDNPRTEKPQQIIDDTLPGFTHERYEVIQDRADAIQALVDSAELMDVILVAGKGHETGQIFADRTEPFDDREVLRNAIESRHGLLD